MSLLIAYGNEQLILTSPDGLAWTQKFKVPATADGQVSFGNIDYDGNQTYVATGEFQLVLGMTMHPGAIVSSTDGGNTWTARTLTGSPQLGGGLRHGAVWAAALGLWCAVGSDFITGKAISVTSPDGVNWTVHNMPAELVLQSVETNTAGTIFVAVNGLVSMGDVSRIYSSTDGATWTLRASLSVGQYSGLAWNGSYFMCSRNVLHGVLLGPGTAENATSPDGINWTEGAAGSGAIIAKLGSNNQPATTHILFDGILNLWVVPSVYTVDGLSSGIYTSSDGRNWTRRYIASTDGSAIVSAITRMGTQLVAIMSGSPWIVTSVDAITWNPLATSLADPSFMLEWTGNNLITYSVPAFGDNFIRSSPTGVTWTNRYDDAVFDATWLQLFSASPTPTTTKCVDFEIQSPGNMPDSGQQFVGQRLLLTVNCNVSGVPQTLTPTLIIDGVEHTLPEITTMKRETLDIPIYGFHGRFFDGVRLNGCLTGRVEVFRVEATVHQGMDGGS